MDSCMDARSHHAPIEIRDQRSDSTQKIKDSTIQNDSQNQKKTPKRLRPQRNDVTNIHTCLCAPFIGNDSGNCIHHDNKCGNCHRSITEERIVSPPVVCQTNTLSATAPRMGPAWKLRDGTAPRKGCQRRGRCILRIQRLQVYGCC